MKIVFDPCQSKTNTYVGIFTSLLRKRGFKAHGLNDFFADWKHFRQYPIVHLNWYENLSGFTFFPLLSSFLKKSAKLWILKLLGRKIVWTMHNRMPHDQQGLFFKRCMMYQMFVAADSIIVHSKSSREIVQSYHATALNKVLYLPHPDYVDVYPAPATTPAPSSDGRLQLLFVGAVKPYKNIELLIEVAKHFPEGLLLTIAGKPMDAAYGQKLKERCASSPQIVLDFRFLPDEQLSAAIAPSDLLVLPYDLKSSLNSGTALLAFSLGKTVICPEIGTISDLEHFDYVFTYRYSTEEEHKQQLINQIARAIRLKQENPFALEAWGRHMFEVVTTQNNKLRVVQRLADHYVDLLAARVPKRSQPSSENKQLQHV